MKVLRWIAYASAAVGAILIILGSIGVVFHTSIFGFHPPMRFFNASDSFLLLAVALFIVTKHCCCNCCETKEEKKEG
jgi:hypothetical protein